MAPPNGPRILTLDIETRPNLAYVWGMWEQNVNPKALQETAQVMCFAAKWLGQREVLFYSDFHDGHAGMVQAAHDLLSKADGLVTYNGKAFDVKHLNREFLLAGLGPPAPHKDIDLIQTTRGRFKFPSTKLDYVARELGVGGKADTGGFETWLGCLRSDPKAWAKMRRYNCRDVRITERVYRRLLPWIKHHPHYALWTMEDCCQWCGSRYLQRRGWAYTSVSRFRQYQCQKCQGWSRGKHADARADLRAVA